MLLMEGWYFCLSQFAIISLHVLFSVRPRKLSWQRSKRRAMTSEKRRATFGSVLRILNKAPVPWPQTSLTHGENEFSSLLPSTNGSDSSLHLINTQYVLGNVLSILYAVAYSIFTQVLGGRYCYYSQLKAEEREGHRS